MVHIIGQKYGRLTPIRRDGEFHLCRCDCGTERMVRTDRIRSGKTKSCGCLAAEMNEGAKRAAEAIRAANPPAPRRVRDKRTPVERQLGRVWNTMKQRCYNPAYEDFKYYGARGITVCPEWVDDSEQFIADMLPQYIPGLWLERKDNSKGYSPENCTFATPKQQAANRRPYGTALDPGLVLF